ncbi:MAG TPA: phosphoribosylanthranilate isomerase [Candidatus Acidoferrales bacterium]|nr:phosphoribosylanthranilate isomerase [Candidatus Acidoferrales bacterium]
MSTRIKFCGGMNWADVSLAIDEGADAAGMIFANSPRRIDWTSAAEIAQRIGTSILPVGVFVDAPLEEVERARWYFPELVVQLSGNESPDFVRAIGGTVWKTFHIGPHEHPKNIETLCDRYSGAMPLFDTKIRGEWGGTGKTFDWSVLTQLARTRPIGIAGGLTPENVASCVRMVRPAWVDVRSGIETNGRKDADKMRRFVDAVRQVDAA